MWKRDATLKPVDLPPVPPAIVPTVMPAAPDTKPVDAVPIEHVVANLGKSMTIRGELTASEDLTLYGHMDGRVTLPDHTLTIGPDGDIREISAGAVVIMGAVVGNVTATKRAKFGQLDQ